MGYLAVNNYKSLNLLYPLLQLKPHSSITTEKNLIDTYCWWKGQKEGIDNYQLLVLFGLDVDKDEFEKYNRRIITPNKSLVNCYNTSEGSLFVFDMIEYREDINKFLDGKYSKFSESSKRTILEYWGELDKKEKCQLIEGEASLPRHVALRPEYYFEEVALELLYKDGGAYLKSVGELWGKPDPEYETLVCDIVKSCTIDYNQLTLNL